MYSPFRELTEALPGFRQHPEHKRLCNLEKEELYRQMINSPLQLPSAGRTHDQMRLEPSVKKQRFRTSGILGLCACRLNVVDA